MNDFFNKFLDVKVVARAALDMAEKYFNEFSGKHEFIQELHKHMEIDISADQLRDILDDTLEWE